MNKFLTVIMFLFINSSFAVEYNKYSEFEPIAYEKVNGTSKNFAAKCGTDYLYNNNLEYCKALSYKLKRVEK